MDVLNYYIGVFCYQVSLLFDFSYYIALAKQYFSIKGFIIGVLFVFIIFMASADRGKNMFLSFIKTIGVFAFINAVSVINYIMIHALNQVFTYDAAFQKIMVPANIVSGLFLILCTHTMNGVDEEVNAFFFGAGAYLSLPMINFILYFSTLTLAFKILVVVEAVLAGAVAAVTAANQNFARSWAVYFVFYMIMNIVGIGLGLANTLNPMVSIPLFIQNAKFYIMDTAIFALVFVLAIIYDKYVVNFSYK